MADNQVRVILWSIPRTVSTAFAKCMSNLEDVQIINEPYIYAYRAGPEKKHLTTDELQKPYDKYVSKTKDIKIDYDGGWGPDIATYKFVKESLLEAEYPGKRVVFVKDMAYAMPHRLDMLPNGYRHAFLIRNPIKVFVSWKKMLNKMKVEFYPGVDFNVLETKNNIIPVKYAFGESFQLYEHLIKSGIEPNPIIIDSDDLLENPEFILKEFCKQIGLRYTDKLLSWDGGDGVVQKWKAPTMYIQGNQILGYYKEAFVSQQFYKPKPVPDRSKLSHDVIKCVDAAMPYYEKMYALRLRPIADNASKISN